MTAVYLVWAAIVGAGLTWLVMRHQTRRARQVTANFKAMADKSMSMLEHTTRAHALTKDRLRSATKVCGELIAKNKLLEDQLAGRTVYKRQVEVNAELLRRAYDSEVLLEQARDQAVADLTRTIAEHVRIGSWTEPRSDHYIVQAVVYLADLLKEES